MKKLSIVLLAFLLIGAFAFADGHEEEEVNPLVTTGDGSLSLASWSVDFGLKLDGGTLKPESGFAGAVSGSIKVDYTGDLVSGGLSVGLIPNVTFTEGKALGDKGAWDEWDAAAFEADPKLAAPYGALSSLYAYAKKYYDADVAADLRTAYPDLFDGDDLKSLSDYMDGTVTAAKLAEISEAALKVYDDLKAKVEDDKNDDDYAASQAAWEALRASVFGAKSDDAYGLSFPVSGAYLKLNNVADLVDITFALSEAKYNVGSMVSSEVGNKPLGVQVDLVAGVVENLSAGMFLGFFPKVAAVSNNLATLGDESADAKDAVWSTQISAGYAIPVEDLLNANLKLDFGVADKWFLSLAPSVSMVDMFGLGFNGELNLKAGSGFAAAGTLKGAVSGISPSFSFYLKNADWGGDGSKEAAKLDGTAGADKVDATNSSTVFSSVDDDGAWRIVGGVSADLEEFIGEKITAAFNLGYGTTFGGDDNALDWNGSLSYALDDLSAGFTIDSDINWGLSAALKLDANTTVSAAFDRDADDDKYVTSVGLSLSF